MREHPTLSSQGSGLFVMNVIVVFDAADVVSELRTEVGGVVSIVIHVPAPDPLQTQGGKHRKLLLR